VYFVYRVRMVYVTEHGPIRGMRIAKKTLSIRRKPTPMRFSPPQIPHSLMRSEAVGSQALKILSISRSKYSLIWKRLGL
jgi:hypothetical protein